MIQIAVIAVLAGVVCVVLAWRHRLKAPALARPAQRPAWAVRAAEGTVLVLLGAVLLLLLIQSNPIQVHDLKVVAANLPELHRAWLTVVLASAAGLALVLAVAALWRPAAAALLMVAWLTGTVTCLTTAWPTVAASMGAAPHAILVLYTLAPRPDYPGVQLYVNGVHLGQAPVTMTMAEFEAKVPYWPEPPEGLTENDLVSSSDQKVARPWTRFETLQYPRSWSPLKHAEARKYYAQAELDGEWGSGFGGGGGGGGGAPVLAYESSLHFRFPKFDARVREHIERAAQAGFHVDAAWVAQAEACGNRAWQLLRERIPKDARCQAVLDQWARLHYRLPEPMTADEARQALDRIAAEAEERGEYDTRGPAGAAIDIVTPHLDLDWLITAANDALRSGYAGYSYSNSSDGFATRRTRDGSGRAMRHYVLAHAVWRTDQRLDAQDDSRPNRIETEVLPTLVYTGRDEADHNQQLQLAIRMGWPGAFDFIYRHNWSRGISGRAPFDHDAVRVGFGENAYVNGWLYLLLNLDRPEARAFRNRYSYLAFDVAARAVEGAGVSLDVEHLGFLFMDPDLGAESLAVKFWPRFLEATRAIQPGNGYWGLLGRARYLARTEPNATDEMYREALAATTGEVSWIPLEALESLPPKRRAEICDIWINQLRAMADHPPKERQLWTEPQAIAGLLKVLESRRKEIRREEPSPGPGR